MNRRLRNGISLCGALCGWCVIAAAYAQPENVASADEPTIANEPAELQSIKSQAADSDQPATHELEPGDQPAPAISEHLDSRVENESGGRESSQTVNPASQMSRRLPAPSDRAGAQLSAGASDGTTGEDQSRTLPVKLPSSNWIVTTVGALGAVIGLMIIIRPAIRKLAGPLAGMRAPSGVIEGLARYPFGKGQSLVLIKVDARVLLLCQTTTGSNLITEFTDPEDVASILRRVHDDRGESFNRKLEEMLRGESGEEMTEAHYTSGGANSFIDLTSEPAGRVSRSLFGRGRKSRPSTALEQLET